MKKYIPAFIAVIILGTIIGIVIGRNQYKRATRIAQPLPMETAPALPIPTSQPTASSADESYPSDFTLSITSPTSDSTVTSPTITVKGKTAPSAEVFINEKDTVADANGNFFVMLTLDEGENLIIVTANDDEGNSAEKELVVTFEAGE